MVTKKLLRTMFVFSLLAMAPGAFGMEEKTDEKKVEMKEEVATQTEQLAGGEFSRVALGSEEQNTQKKPITTTNLVVGALATVATIGLGIYGITMVNSGISAFCLSSVGGRFLQVLDPVFERPNIFLGVSIAGCICLKSIIDPQGTKEWISSLGGSIKSRVSSWFSRKNLPDGNKDKQN